MKIVIAPDTFKECISASHAAAAMARGVLEAAPDAVIDLCPMADGGGGTVEAMIAATGGRLLAADVFSPLGSPIRSHFGMLGGTTSAPLPGELGLTGSLTAADNTDAPAPTGATAVIEMSAASGLHLVSPERRDPMRTTTFGTGQLILAALDAGATKIILGIGNSATVDGGCGCARRWAWFSWAAVNRSSAAWPAGRLGRSSGSTPPTATPASLPRRFAWPAT